MPLLISYSAIVTVGVGHVNGLFEITVNIPTPPRAINNYDIWILAPLLLETNHLTFDIRHSTYHIPPSPPPQPTAILEFTYLIDRSTTWAMAMVYKKDFSTTVKEG
jgi:hypothetical protein